jgi:hypothetical protein
MTGDAAAVLSSKKGLAAMTHHDRPCCHQGTRRTHVIQTLVMRDICPDAPVKNIYLKVKGR